MEGPSLELNATMALGSGCTSTLARSAHRRRSSRGDLRPRRQYPHLVLKKTNSCCIGERHMRNGPLWCTVRPEYFMPCGKPSYIGWKTTNEIRCKPVRGIYVNEVLVKLWYYWFTCLALSTMPPAQITASCYLTKTLAFNWSPKHPTAQTSASLSINGFIGAQLVIGNNQKDTQKYEEYICRKTNEMRT